MWIVLVVRWRRRRWWRRVVSRRLGRVKNWVDGWIRGEGKLGGGELEVGFGLGWEVYNILTGFCVHADISHAFC